jgi:hypothetical protein
VLLPQLRRIRWAVRATLLLGVAASVLANILHALDNPISQAIAAWPPVALLLTVELISRVPVHRRLLAATRLFATATIAGIAAWVSYWHMAGVAARYGETGASPYLLPLSVDGLIVVASICLVELGGRIASMEQPAGTPASPRATAPASKRTAQPVPQTAQPVPQTAPPVPQTAPPAPQTAPPAPQTAPPAPQTVPQTAPPAPAHAESSAASPAVEAPQPGFDRVIREDDEVSHIMVDAFPEETTRAETPDPGLIRAAAARTGADPLVTAQTAHAATAGMPSPLRRSTAAALAEAATALPRSTTGFTPTVTRSGNAQPLSRGSGGPSARNGGLNNRPAPSQRRATSPTSQPGRKNRARRSPAETVALAARIKAERPGITEAELAAELGISQSRWRTVRREAAGRDLAA